MRSVYSMPGLRAVFRLRQDARAPNNSGAWSHAPESGQFVLHPKVLDGNHMMLPHRRRQSRRLQV
jgi:hypothetical protein